VWALKQLLDAKSFEQCVALHCVSETDPEVLQELTPFLSMAGPRAGHPAAARLRGE
jgi:hypothetical protein